MRNLLLLSLLLAPFSLPGQHLIRVFQTLRTDYNYYTGRVTINQILPPDIPGRQEVLEMRFSHQPVGIYEKDGAEYAHFDLLGLDLKIPLTIGYDILVHPYDYKTAGERKAIPVLEATDLATYLKNNGS